MKVGAFLDLCEDTLDAIERVTPNGGTVHDKQAVTTIVTSLEKHRLLRDLNAYALVYQGNHIEKLMDMVEQDVIWVAQMYGVPDIDDYLRRIR